MKLYISFKNSFFDYIIKNKIKNLNLYKKLYNLFYILVYYKFNLLIGI